MSTAVLNTRVRKKKAAKRKARWDLFPWQQGFSVLEHGDGQLDSIAPLVKTLWLDHENVAERFRLKLYGIFALQKVPVAKYGQGPHYLLVEQRMVTKDQELFTQLRGSCSTLPVALIGSPQKISSLKNCTALTPYTYLPKTLSNNGRGRVIGVAKYDLTEKQFSVKLMKEGPKIRIYPFVTFQSRKSLKRSMKTIKELTKDSASNSIHFLRQQIEAATLQIITASVISRDLAIPIITYGRLKNYAHVINGNGS